MKRFRGVLLQLEGKTIPGERKTKTVTRVFEHPKCISIRQFISNTNLLCEHICYISNILFFYVSVYTHAYV